MAQVNLTGVRKSFGPVEVIKGVNLKIDDGEFVVFVGPSGCGKSTLLRMIAGLEEVTAGTVSIGGKVMNDQEPAERGIAMVFQSYALYPHMTVAENMAFALNLAKADKAETERRVKAAAEVLNIAGLLDRKPKALSGGQRQRVAIGRAIVREPEVFLFDEPLSNLDAALRVRMRYEFAELHRRLRTTMVYVTHDQIEAMTLADRIVVLNGGAIEQVGAPMELYESPANLFVAEFIGSPKMNLIQGEIVAASAQGATVRLDSGETIEAAVDATAAKAREAVTVGVRPEHLTTIGSGGDLRVTASFVESLGNATYAYVAREGRDETLTVQLPGEVRPAVGDALTLHLPADKAYLFDAEGRAFTRLEARRLAA